jgi:hypothetical protein
MASFFIFLLYLSPQLFNVACFTWTALSFILFYTQANKLRVYGASAVQNNSRVAAEQRMRTNVDLTSVNMKPCVRF